MHNCINILIIRNTYFSNFVLIHQIHWPSKYLAYKCIMKILLELSGLVITLTLQELNFQVRDGQRLFTLPSKHKLGQQVIYHPNNKNQKHRLREQVVYHPNNRSPIKAEISNIEKRVAVKKKMAPKPEVNQNPLSQSHKVVQKEGHRKSASQVLSYQLPSSLLAVAKTANQSNHVVKTANQSEKAAKTANCEDC